MNYNRDLYIYGAGGLGRDIYWHITRINKYNRLSDSEEINFKGFIDDNENLKNKKIFGYEVINFKKFKNLKGRFNVVIAIGSSKIRRGIVEKLIKLDNIEFPNLIDPSVAISNTSKLGKGVIICANTTISVETKISDFTIVNANCIIGHDSQLNNFVTLYPGSIVSGNTHIGKNTELGTNSCVLQNLKIGNNNMIGAGAVVTKNFENNNTIVGIPGKELI